MDEPHPDDLAPEDALRRLLGFTVDKQRANPDLVRLMATEDILARRAPATEAG